MRKILTLVLVGFLTGIIGSPAYAGGKKKIEVVWNPPHEEAVSSLFGGAKVCFGDSKHYNCSVYDPLNNERVITTVIRPKGLGKNQSITRIQPLNAEGKMLTDSNGLPLYKMVSSDHPNAAAIWTDGFARVPSAAAQGIGLGFANSGGCGNNCTPSSVIINDVKAGAVSGSNANAGAGVTVDWK